MITNTYRIDKKSANRLHDWQRLYQIILAHNFSTLERLHSFWADLNFVKTEFSIFCSVKAKKYII